MVADIFQHTEARCIVLIAERPGQKARAEKAKVKYTIKCSECSKWLETTRSRQKFCTTACADRFHYRVRDVERRKRMLSNGEVHRNISMERLIKRDKSICYLCGYRVNRNDYIIDDNDNYIAGDFHPSIEHVMPISKGGTHTWDNVKIAHRICNTIKSDKEINETKYKQKLNMKYKKDDPQPNRFYVNPGEPVEWNQLSQVASKSAHDPGGKTTGGSPTKL